MTKRLAEGKRIRTIQLGWIGAVATTVTLDAVMASHTFQDDVTLIGAQILGEWLVEDAEVNADGRVTSLLELSRQAQRAQPGVILMLAQQAVWTAAISVSGELRKHALVMFPEGYGIEIDEGEAVNFLAFMSYIGGAGPIDVYGNSILYYVER